MYRLVQAEKESVLLKAKDDVADHRHHDHQSPLRTHKSSRWNSLSLSFLVRLLLSCIPLSKSPPRDFLCRCVAVVAVRDSSSRSLSLSLSLSLSFSFCALEPFSFAFFFFCVFVDSLPEVELDSEEVSAPSACFRTSLEESGLEIDDSMRRVDPVTPIPTLDSEEELFERFNFLCKKNYCK